MGFLRFSLLCLDFLAWPAFALVYPLWDSIRAIETSSKDHMKKLVTYWTIFSLISLFEIFFVKLIEWVPFWPYIKLVAICWLVIPRFNGSCLAYQHLIHPCLYVNPQEIISWWSIPKEKPYSEDSFLASVETYLKENGPEALEKLIASKAKHSKHILNDADAPEVVKRMEPIEEYVTAEEQLVEHPKLHLVESEKKEVAGPEAQMGTIPAVSKEKRLSEIHDLKKAQREWTCVVCQLTTESEATLNSHLLGKKHRSKCEKLKISEHTTKNTQASTAEDKSHTEELETSRQTSNDLKSSATKTNDSNQTNMVEDPNLHLVESEKKEVAAPEAQMSTIPAEIKEKRLSEIHALKKVQREWTCAVCQLTTQSEATLNSHLLGKKHRSKCEELKISAQTTKNSQSSTAKDKSNTEELETSRQTSNDLKSSPMKINDSNQTNMVEDPNLHLVESEKKDIAAPEAQMGTIPAESKEKRLSEIHSLKKVQIEWTCAVCQMTMGSAATFNSHLLGREHKSKCEKLKISARTTKNMQSSAAKDKSNTEELKTSRQTSNDLKSSATKTNYSNQTKNDPKMCLPGERSRQNTTEKPKSIHTDASSRQQMQEKPKEINASVQQQPEFWCSICNITCSGETNMDSHLKGRKHLFKMKMISSIGSGQA